MKKSLKNVRWLPSGFEIFPRLVSLAVLPLLLLAGGCISGMMPGNLAEIQTTSDQPRAGNVYLIRGWNGAFSWGIDELGKALNEQGVRARVFRHEQRDELAAQMVAVYRSAKNFEPLCLVAHSAGSDDALWIARELKKVGVQVDLIVTLDNVDETLVPNNVKLCYNYWCPKENNESNFCRGLPFKQEPGGTGRLVNVNLYEEGKDLAEPGANHLTLDKDQKLRQAIIKNVLAVCPPRASWRPTSGFASVPAAASVR